MGAAAALRSPGVSMARALPAMPPGAWALATFAGRFVEITGESTTAASTLSAQLIVEVQRGGGLAAWVMGTRQGFFPPDLAAAGVDLRQLAVLRVEDAAKRWRVCDTLLRSGSFPLVVVQAAAGVALPLAAQTRLGAVAQHHNATLLAITRRGLREGGPRAGAHSEGGRSSLVSMRAETFRVRQGHDCFVCGAEISKDKRGLPGWRHEDHCRGTNSLC